MPSPAASLASVLSLLLAGCAATDPRDLDRLFAAHDDHPVQVAAMVVDLASGELLLAREATRLFRPASTMKLLTTAAICRRAPDGALETTLSVGHMAAPHADTATLTGGGDPFLSAADLQTLARGLHSKGVTGLSTVKVVDPLRNAPRFGEGWMWDDEPAPFMPTISAAPVDGGCVTVEVRGTEGTPEAQLLPVAGGLRCTVLGGDGPLQVDRGRYRDPDLVVVSGRLDAGQVTRRRISVPDPAAYTGWLMADLLGREGLLQGGPQVQVRDSAEGDPPRRYELRVQRPMAETVLRTNKDSDNLGAELLLRHLGTLGDAPVPLGPGSVHAGVAVLRQDIGRLGLDPDDYRLVDGSGVSHYDLVSAELLVRLLVDMHRLGGREFLVFRESLPIAGRDGTLSSRLRDTVAEGRVRAKTGTVSGVSNLAGYVETASGRQLAFAILVQNFVGTSRPWRELQDRFCEELSRL